jgi:hypothetical protein
MEVEPLLIAEWAFKAEIIWEVVSNRHVRLIHKILPMCVLQKYGCFLLLTTLPGFCRFKSI